MIRRLIPMLLLFWAVSLSAEFRSAPTGTRIEPVSLPGSSGQVELPAAGHWQFIITVAPDARKSTALLKDLNWLTETLSGAEWTAVVVLAESSPDDPVTLEVPEGATIAYDVKRAWYERLGLFVFPASALVDPDGVLVWQRSGHSRDWRDVTEDSLRHFLGLPEVAREQPTGPSVSRDAERQYQLAMALTRDHRPADARAALDSALQLDSTYALAYLQLAGLYRLSNHSDSAHEAYEKALTVDTSLYRAWVGLGDLALDQGDTTGALAAADRALDLNARSPEAMKLKSQVLLQQGHNEEAEQLLNLLLQMSPGKADTRYYLGLVYERTGRTELALEAYREALLLLLEDQQDRQH